jgi:PBP1b-binding outer membrane lipoprotein LpoB
MKTVQRGLVAAASAAFLSGCAASPESIKPANINTAQYAYLNCAQLASFKVTLNGAYNEAANSEDNARNIDTATNILIGLPVGSMTHESVPYQVADLKGRIVAVEKLQVHDNCRAR